MKEIPDKYSESKQNVSLSDYYWKQLGFLTDAHQVFCLSDSVEYKTDIVFSQIV